MDLIELVNIADANVNAAHFAKQELDNSTLPVSIDSFISLSNVSVESLQSILAIVHDNVFISSSLAQIYIDMGDVYLERQEFENSTPYFSIALETLQGVGEVTAERLTKEFSNGAFNKYPHFNNIDIAKGILLLAEAKASKGMSRSLSKQGNSAESSEYWRRAKAAYETLLSGKADHHTGGVAMINYGNMLLEEGNIGGAKEIHLRTVAMYSQLEPFYAKEALRELGYISNMERGRN